MDSVKWSVLLSTLLLALLFLFLGIYSATSMPTSILSGANEGLECSDENPDAPGCIPADQIDLAFMVHRYSGIMYLIMLFLAPIAIFISNAIASREVLKAKATSGSKTIWLLLLWVLPSIGALAYLFHGRNNFKAS